MALKKSVQGWFRKADEDIFTAENNRSTKNELGFNPIAFHCQQAIEKSLKAFLTHHEISFIYKHDLVYLLDLASKVDPSLIKIFEPAFPLNPYAIAARYPDAPLVGELTLEDVDRYIALAIQCRKEILSRVHDKGPLF